MRIVHLARYGSVRGGAESYVAALCEGQRAAGHDVALLYAREPDARRPEVASGALLGGLDDADGSAGERLDAALAARAPDVVHAHLPDVAWVAPRAKRAAPVVLAVHDHRLDCPVGTRYWAAWKRACDIRPGPWCLAYNVAAHCGSLKANATLRPYVGWRAALRAARGLRIQVFSHAVRALMTKAGIDEAAVEVTPYPVPPLPLPRPPRNDDRRPVVLASGRITKEKGFAQLVDAVDRSGAAVHLVIAGEGHSRSSVERHAASAGGRHRITFTGWLDAADLAGWREAASVVAVPSMWPEPFGIVGLEAMAAGKPVVAFDTGGIREWLVDGETGALAPAGDVEAFGRALGALLADEARARAMGEAGRARAASVFALDAHVARVDELYRVVREAWRPDA